MCRTDRRRACMPRRPCRQTEADFLHPDIRLRTGNCRCTPFRRPSLMRHISTPDSGRRASICRRGPRTCPPCPICNGPGASNDPCPRFRPTGHNGRHRRPAYRRRATDAAIQVRSMPPKGGVQLAWSRLTSGFRRAPLATRRPASRCSVTHMHELPVRAKPQTAKIGCSRGALTMTS